MSVTNQILNIIDTLTHEIQILQSKLTTLPDGDLLCVKNGKYMKWYKKDPNNSINPIYIPKENRSYAEDLALRKYYIAKINRKSKEIFLLNKYLFKENKIKEKPDQLFDDSSFYHSLLTSQFHSFSDTLNKWANDKFDRNTRYPEHLIHKSVSGHFVRSKSETIIANSLFTNKIPYRYECAICLENSIFYPDFTIRHPQTLETIYWEHFGMMDKSSYCENAYNKLKIYGSNGIIPSINLITTFETRTHPIDSCKIQQVIKEYFF